MVCGGMRFNKYCTKCTRSILFWVQTAYYVKDQSLASVRAQFAHLYLAQLTNGSRMLLCRLVSFVHSKFLFGTTYQTSRFVFTDTTAPTSDYVNASSGFPESTFSLISRRDLSPLALPGYFQLSSTPWSYKASFNACFRNNGSFVVKWLHLSKSIWGIDLNKDSIYRFLFLDKFSTNYFVLIYIPSKENETPLLI